MKKAWVLAHLHWVTRAVIAGDAVEVRDRLLDDRLGQWGGVPYVIRVDGKILWLPSDTRAPRDIQERLANAVEFRTEEEAIMYMVLMG